MYFDSKKESTNHVYLVMEVSAYLNKQKCDIQITDRIIFSIAMVVTWLIIYKVLCE